MKRAEEREKGETERNSRHHHHSVEECQYVQAARGVLLLWPGGPRSSWSSGAPLAQLLRDVWGMRGWVLGQEMQSLGQGHNRNYWISGVRLEAHESGRNAGIKQARHRTGTQGWGVRQQLGQAEEKGRTQAAHEVQRSVNVLTSIQREGE